MRLSKLLLISLGMLIFSGCVSMPTPHDYGAFHSADPNSILVLPPINNTTEVIAPYSVLSQTSFPISESGYYVFPVAVVEQTFKNNGLTIANDVHAVPIQKLREIFGADAALYMTINEYGTSYAVIASETRVTIEATLVDLRTGTVLWKDTATASSAEGRSSNSGGIISLLVEAAISQIVETVADAGYNISGITTTRLLSADLHNGLLYGPRSPKYKHKNIAEQSK